ncbi:hypothetical protein D3C87_1321390 [compost metagenome]
MENIVHEVASHISTALELIASIIIAIGALEATLQTVVPWVLRKSTHGMRRTAWLGFARWILLGLEFTLAADIVRTASTPTWDAIGQLAAVALIRTFLSYFLERDLEAYESEEGPLTQKDVL